MIEEVEGLARVIDIIARRCWKGLAALRGDAPEPTREQLKAAFLFKPSRPVGSSSRPADASVDPKAIRDEDAYQCGFERYLAAVTWAEIVAAVTAYRKNPMTARNWDIYSGFINLRSMVRSRTTYGGQADYLAERYDVDKSTVYDVVKYTPRCIAHMISADPGAPSYRPDSEGQMLISDIWPTDSPQITDK